jgi:tetratricopeptide (TPR) repeat protein
MGDWLHRLGRDEGALDAYQEALVEAPQHAEAMYALGRMVAESGLEYDIGVDALQRFLALPPWPQDPEPKLAWWQLGRIHARAGCNEKAEAAFRRALALDPGWRAPRRSLDQLAEDRRPNASCEPVSEPSLEQAQFPAAGLADPA